MPARQLGAAACIGRWALDWLLRCSIKKLWCSTQSCLFVCHPVCVLCRSDAGPLLEVELELVTPDMVWEPDLGGSEKGTVQGLVERWLTSFLEVSSGPPLFEVSVKGISKACLPERHI